MAIYLIDYENVYIDGLQGIEALDEKDIVHIFYTQNRCGLTFDLHQKLLSSKARVQLNEVSISPKNNDPVKNALDIQLMMFTGFLIGSKASDTIFIISKDKDFLLGSDFFSRYIPDDSILLTQVSSIAEGCNLLKSLKEGGAAAIEATDADRFAGIDEDDPLDDYTDMIEEQREEYRPYAKKVVKRESLAAVADRFAREEAAAAPLYARIDLDELPEPEPETMTAPAYSVQYYNTVRNLLGKNADPDDVTTICGIIGEAEDLVSLNNGLALFYRDNDRAKAVYHKCKPRFEDLRHLARASQRRGK